MFAVKVDREPALRLLALRPVLTEARLITEKHARDAIYVATLAEELHRVEAKVALVDELLQLGPPDEPNCTPGNAPNVDWFHQKATELDRRMRRIEGAGHGTQGKQGVLLRRPATIAFA